MWGGGSSEILSPPNVVSPLPPLDTVLGVFSKAAVVTAGAPCAGVGRDILEAGGSAVDAAIATLLCDGVCAMQAMGVGGGFLMTIYDKQRRAVCCLDARESAPYRATPDMFLKNNKLSINETFIGALSAGVPGELKGMQEAHRRFGKLSWSDLFQPTIRLCEEGINVSKALASSLQSSQKVIRASPTLSAVLLDQKGELPQEGQLIRLPQLAVTLRTIASSPRQSDELYSGSLTTQFVNDIQRGGGIITEKDMADYQVHWKDPDCVSLSGGHILYTVPLAGSGPLLGFILRILDGPYQKLQSELDRAQFIIEALKHAYGQRTRLGDPFFLDPKELKEVLRELKNEVFIRKVKQKIKLGETSQDPRYYGATSGEDKDSHGTNNIAVLAPDGSAVCVSSTINWPFGSKFVSPSTGILINNEMGDFSSPGKQHISGLPPTKVNLIEPGKRPMSSMVPSIVLDNRGDVRLVLGAAGGSRITSVTTLVLIRHLWEGKNLKEAIDQARFHHQLFPMKLFYEYGVTQSLVEGLQKIGHNTSRISSKDLLAKVTGIAVQEGVVTVSYDGRKPGSFSGI